MLFQPTENIFYTFLPFQTPQNSQPNTPNHVPSPRPVAENSLSNSNSVNSIDDVIFRDGTNTTNDQSVDNNGDEEEPIAPIQPPIYSKTKNWYSGFCNRWASIIGVSIFIK